MELGPTVFFEEYEKILEENIKQNITSTVEKWSDVEFYFFIPPYSICWWDDRLRKGELDYYMQALEREVEMLLKYDNVKLFIFSNNYDLVCNLDNYKDYIHYGPHINTQILNWMAEDMYLITKENYHEILEEMKEFYVGYDYESIYE